MSEKTMPRVLIISHTCFSSNDAMGSTLASYFSEYDPNCVAQFYIKNMTPNLKTCERYFRVTDDEVLGKILHPWRKSIGTEVALSQDDLAKSHTAPPDERAQGNRALKMLLREAVWSTKVWNNRKLRDWICTFQPDLILCQPGDFPYLFKLSVKLAKKYRIPLVIHQSETYYLKPMQQTDLPYKLYRRIYKKAYEKLMANCSAAVYLCDAIKEDYDRFFSCPSYCIMKSTGIVPQKKAFHAKEDYKFLYAGNVGVKVGRAEPLVQIGKALKQLGYALDVYTPSSGEHMAQMTPENGVHLHGAVPYDELQKIIADSDFIIHAESREEKTVVDLQYAFSTKIADMLASGCCPIVYGSTRIAAIRYFKDTETACVIETPEELEEKLRALLQSPQSVEKIVEKALWQAERYHLPKRNSEAFISVLQQAANSIKKRRRKYVTF